jgi:hypothetical protein
VRLSGPRSRCTRAPQVGHGSLPQQPAGVFPVGAEAR